MKYIATDDFCIEEPTAVCIGKFEGLHLGHRSLVEKAKEQGFKTLLLALDMNHRPSLFQKDERALIAERMVIDYMVAFPFGESLKRMSPDEFCRQVLITRCHTACVIVGEDFRFGYERKGTAETLRKLGKEYGFSVFVLPKKKYEGDYISSSRIYHNLLKGNCNDAREMLGFPYFFSGKVVRGNQIGRTLQMPTANLEVPEGKVVPPKGVYATITHIGDAIYGGVTNIGEKPTVEDKQKMGVETFLFDFDEEIYGKKIQVDLYKFLRPEQKFSGLSELKKNMFCDKENAKKYLYSISGKHLI